MSAKNNRFTSYPTMGLADQNASANIFSPPNAEIVLNTILDPLKRSFGSIEIDL